MVDADAVPEQRPEILCSVRAVGNDHLDSQ
jgi:hypothetical protein